MYFRRISIFSATVSKKYLKTYLFVSNHIYLYLLVSISGNRNEAANINIFEQRFLSTFKQARRHGDAILGNRSRSILPAVYAVPPRRSALVVGVFCVQKRGVGVLLGSGNTIKAPGFSEFRGTFPSPVQSLVHQRIGDLSRTQKSVL